jgi:hypothetical protein
MGSTIGAISPLPPWVVLTNQRPPGSCRTSIPTWRWHLKSRLDDGSISTAELNILRQFLKDNGISAQPVAGTSFGDLVASLPDLDKVVQMPRRKVA